MDPRSYILNIKAPVYKHSSAEVLAWPVWTNLI